MYQYLVPVHSNVLVDNNSTHVVMTYSQYATISSATPHTGVCATTVTQHHSIAIPHSTEYYAATSIMFTVHKY